MSNKIKRFYEFTNFRLDAENASLWREDELVAISPKALETLILLVQKNGEIVSRDELLEAVWKDTFVEEGNINYTISLLRKTLDNKDLIQTVARRGYRFVGKVKEPSPKKNASIGSEPVLLNSASSPAKSSVRWVLTAVLLISLLFVTSFAYWWRETENLKPVAKQQTANPEALAAYTRGKMIIASRNVKNREEKAIDEFQKAVTLDPTFALAYAGLAEGYASNAVKFSGRQSSENYEKAKKAVEKALALNENLAEAYNIRGLIKRNADWDLAGAEIDLRRAIELDPNNAVAHQRLSQTLAPTGKFDEALEEVKLAYRLDPIAESVLGGRFPILEARREYDLALKESEEFAHENKENVFAARAYATFLYHTGNYYKTIEICEEKISENPERNPFAWLSLLAGSYKKTGQPEKSDEALKKLESISQNDTKALYSLIMNYAELGRFDEAFAGLQRCFDEREERMIWIKLEPRFENLHGDARFQELVKKMNFPE